jgi:hypothetical protein
MYRAKLLGYLRAKKYWIAGNVAPISQNQLVQTKVAPAPKSLFGPIKPQMTLALKKVLAPAQTNPWGWVGVHTPGRAPIIQLKVAT